MKTLNCIIVDDEPIARDVISGYLSKIPGMELVKSCKNATEAYEALHDMQIDLVFLDIQMPVITGTDFLRSLRRPPLVIFTTAYPNFALEGFELNSIDYLLKPITFERFYLATQKALERADYLKMSKQPLSVQFPDHIYIKQHGKLLRISCHHISYIKAGQNDCVLYINDEPIIATMPLKSLMIQLPPILFIRVHRSYVVNLKQISAIKGNCVYLDKNEVPIGASYKVGFIKILNI